MAHVPVRELLRPLTFDAVADEAVPSGLLDDLARPLVYLTLGTVWLDAGVLAEAIEGIGALDVSLLVTVGHAHDPAELGPQPARVRVERYVPQSLVLSHCDVVVSHAGSGTFLGALAHGLPQLFLPQSADQFDNAASGVRAGAGLALLPGEADALAIRAAVERLLTEPAFATAATGVAAEIAAMPSPAAVAATLEAMV